MAARRAVVARDERDGATRVLVPPAAPDPDVGEEAFLQLVLDLARWCGWAVYHTRDSRRSPEGFPDLVLCRPPRVVYAELKTATGKVGAAQERWLARLRDCQREAYLWRPDDWDALLATLVR
jgi:hypothetical protein